MGIIKLMMMYEVYLKEIVTDLARKKRMPLYLQSIDIFIDHSINFKLREKYL